MNDSNETIYNRRTLFQPRSSLKETLISPAKSNYNTQASSHDNNSGKMPDNANQIVGRRARSNSRSAGSTSNEPMEQFSMDKVNNNTESTLSKNTANIIQINNPGSPDLGSVNAFKGLDDTNTTILKSNANNIPNMENLTMRERYNNIVVLKPLNSTFETKHLVVPHKPDVIKLGRPVINNNSNCTNTYKGLNERNAQHKKSNIRNDNGNFNSRVLSRNHAALTCDSNTGKIFIRDLKSSNGTFINGTRIGTNDVELSVGDVIDLGTDIDNKQEHRRISALVDNILSVPLVNETVDMLNSNTFFSEKRKNSFQTSSNKHTGVGSDVESNQDIVSTNSKANPIAETLEHNYLSKPALSSKHAAFEAAMFGDVNNIDLENDILGTETALLSEIFIDNSSGTSANLINIMKILSTEIALEKLENQKLKAMDNFLVNFTVNIDNIDNELIQKNQTQIDALQENLKHRLYKKHNKILDNTYLQVEQLQLEKERLEEDFELQEKKQAAEFQSLITELDTLKEDLGSKSVLNESFGVSYKDRDLNVINKTTKFSNETKEKYLDLFGEKSDSSNWKSGLILILSTAFVGFVAYALNLSSKNCN
ncbi:hypothetical protein TPHA_0C02270 [Tetrapisispora phaffii CBS 4417]|uniref:FHA domain-containing protein n=1 Tax=Tetrapisispora phaffii (strain ATCC 24235 / CBS 4417 / NBRC 1672 / NRRL Y-8282 / UCD 70-5) TaxID=1071381 RepID=G8BRK4_TETPH|nr:hypothetical protein TPHA_0C02270 [Tetrapisispora phaffii CBS 4417]CCE62380.1 hypothetical protein TPHA_0C02270 [Tetrapisispora phaffii CBS 4417]